MIGKVLIADGPIFDSDEMCVVHKIMKKGAILPKHNHPGYSVFFTLVKGRLDITLNDDEFYSLQAGKVLQFEGENILEAEVKADSEVFIFLSKRP